MINLADTDELINKILSDEKLKKALNKSDKIYHDEPIIRPASQLKNVTPFRIQKLKNMMWSAKYQILSSERSFYLLSDFMKDYEDDFEGEVKEFNHYLPSYYEMTEPQMRAYFSWRTNVRRGNVKKTFLSFAYVYIFELLNLRGAESPEDAFEKLCSFYNTYKEIDENICSDAQGWLQDFVVYYDLPNEYALRVFDVQKDDICKRLWDPDLYSDDELFEAVKIMSAYNIEESVMFRKYEKLTKYAVCKVYRALNKFFLENRTSCLCGYCIGTECKYPHVMFYKALVYDSKKYKDHIYIINDMRKYICSGGRWLISGMMYSGNKNLTLGKIVEACDAILRDKTDFEDKLTFSLKTKYIIKIIKKEIGSIKIKNVNKSSSEHQIEIDVSKLDMIRLSADKIRDKLIVDDKEEISEKNFTGQSTEAVLSSDIDIKPEPESSVCADDIYERKTNDEENEYDQEVSDISLLDSTESEFLKLILEDSDYHSYIKKNKLLVSVITDSINEKLFEYFDDTVLESDGNEAVIIEDYREELKKMFSKGNNIE